MSAKQQLCHDSATQPSAQPQRGSGVGGAGTPAAAPRGEAARGPEAGGVAGGAGRAARFAGGKLKSPAAAAATAGGPADARVRTERALRTAA